MPPTPVAAPWYGSTADGWLCDSILNATASPSPIEMTPAFSPGPATTPSPAVGSVRSSGFELLYEQCSLHMTLNIASSRSFGSRPPSRSRMASSSSSVTPSRRWSGSTGRSATVIATPRAGGDRDRLGRPLAARAALSTSERMIAEPVVGAEDGLGRPFRVRHQARDVAGGVRGRRRSPAASRSGCPGRPGRPACRHAST